MTKQTHSVGSRNELIDGVAAHQGFTHQRAPLKWPDGFPLGNGDLGVMLWGNGHPLALTLDKADLWDLRINGDLFGHPDCSYAGLCLLVAEGAFRVSAVRRAGRTVWVRIVAGVNRALILKDPFDGAEASVDGPADAQVRRDGNRWHAELKRGRAVSWTRAGESVNPAAVEKTVRASDMSLLGLR